jgi:hypothetical protein
MAVVSLIRKNPHPAGRGFFVSRDRDLEMQAHCKGNGVFSNAIDLRQKMISEF